MAGRKVPRPPSVSAPEATSVLGLPSLTHGGGTTTPRRRKPSRGAGTSRDANSEVPWIVTSMTQLQTASGDGDGVRAPTNTTTRGPAVGEALLRCGAAAVQGPHQPAVPLAIPSFLSLGFLHRTLGTALTFRSDTVTARHRLGDAGHMTERQEEVKHFQHFF